jgi:hypothetical protein
MLNELMFKTISKLASLKRDRRGVSHTLEIIGGVALVAGILITTIPAARTAVVNVWSSVINSVTSLFNSTAA